MTSFNAEMNAMLDHLGAANDGFVVAALYKFVSLDDIDGLRQTLQQLCDKNQILGTVLLAEEGINGTIAAPRDGMTQFLSWLEADGRFDQLSLKFSFNTSATVNVEPSSLASEEISCSYLPTK